MADKHKFSPVRLNSDVAEQLSDCNSAIASASLRRYFWLLKAAKPQFSSAEWNLLRDACNSWASVNEPPETLSSGLALQVEEALVDEDLDVKWAVDRNVFLKKIALLSNLEAIAIVETVEAYRTGG